MTVTPLHTDMDALKAGPGGQTLGELKQAVLDTRSAFLSALARAEADDELMDRYDDAVRLLKAAYVRMGLPYTAPKL